MPVSHKSQSNLANFRKFKCFRELFGNFFSGYFIRGGNFFYCIHTGHEVFFGQPFLRGTYFFLYLFNGAICFFDRYIYGARHFFECPNSYWPAPFHVNFVHSLRVGKNLKMDHYGRDVYQILQFAQICENFKVAKSKKCIISGNIFKSP